MKSRLKKITMQRWYCALLGHSAFETLTLITHNHEAGTRRSDLVARRCLRCYPDGEIAVKTS